MSNEFETGFGRPDLSVPGRRPLRPPGEGATLVTGGCGFLGSFVCRALLESGRQVCVLDVRPFAPEGRFVLGERLGEVPVEIGSVEDRTRVFDLVRRYDVTEIVHLAAIIDPGILARSRDTAVRVNVGGAQNVLESALALDVERIVNFSSIGVLPAVVYEPVDGAHPVLLPDRGPGTDFYGATKVAAEALCFAYHQALGVEFRTIRPSAVYGLGMNPWVGPIKAMVEGAVRGEQLRFEHGGKHPRAYTHAEDVASLVVAVLGAPPGSDRIFYGSTGGPMTTTSEVARIVREVVSGADVEIGEELSEAEKPVVALRGRLSVDNARAQLGWAPRYLDIRDGIAQYAAHYRAFLESGEAR
jgi:UDP-glucose 4-epimerase